MNEPLKRGFCPVCNKVIMNQTKTAYVNGGMEFWVKCSDGSRAQFSMCGDCYEKITPAQLDQIMRSQIVNWGMEVAAQLKWFYEKAVFLKITEHAKTKDGLSPTT